MLVLGCTFFAHGKIFDETIFVFILSDGAMYRNRSSSVLTTLMMLKVKVCVLCLVGRRFYLLVAFFLFKFGGKPLITISISLVKYKKFLM